MCRQQMEKWRKKWMALAWVMRNGLSGGDLCADGPHGKKYSAT